MNIYIYNCNTINNLLKLAFSGCNKNVLANLSRGWFNRKGAAIIILLASFETLILTQDKAVCVGQWCVVCLLGWHQGGSSLHKTDLWTRRNGGKYQTENSNCTFSFKNQTLNPYDSNKTMFMLVESPPLIKTINKKEKLHSLLRPVRQSQQQDTKFKKDWTQTVVTSPP